MITTIAKHFTFDAAHYIPTVPDGHKCRRMHGHTYGVEFRFRGPTSKEGFCRQIDYADIAEVWDQIFATIDHRVLNEIPGLEIPTTEVLAPWLLTTFRLAALVLSKDFIAHGLDSVRVSESSTTWCEVFTKDMP